MEADRILLHRRGDHAVPAWLRSADLPWLRALIDHAQRFVGQPARELDLEGPLRVPAPAPRQATAASVLAACFQGDPSPIDARALRRAVFARAAAGEPAAQVLAEEGARLGIDDPGGQLFADLPGERRLSLRRPLPDPAALLEATNLALAKAILQRSSRVILQIEGYVRPVVRLAHLQRLLYVARPRPTGMELELSGPYALFAHTTRYGRALASLVGPLVGCERWEVAATVRLRGEELSVRLRQGDPIPVSELPPPFDSKLEQRFAKDFARAAPEWDLVREPEPVRAGDRLVFPDFALQHRRFPERRWLLEIAGFWTQAYLAEKLARLRAARLDRLILCVPRGAACTADELPADAEIVAFDRKIDVEQVLARLG